MLLSWDDFPNQNFERSLTFLIPYWQVHRLVFPQSYCQERVVLTHSCPWCVLAYTHTLYKRVIIPQNSTILGAGTGGRQSLQVDIAAIRMYTLNPNLVGPHAFEDVYPYYIAYTSAIASGSFLTSVSFYIVSDFVLVSFGKIMFDKISN